MPPLTTLPPDVLLASLAEEYVFASLCEAAMHAFVAENEARAATMVRARRKVQDILADCACPSTGFGRKRSLRNWWSWQAVAWPRPGDVLRPNTRLCHANTASGGTPYLVSAPEPLSQPCP